MTTTEDYHEDYIRQRRMLKGIPYITIVQDTQKRRVVPFMNVSDQINTIHGTLDTRGCWMMLRNKMWNWPKEENNYYKLMAVYGKGVPINDIKMNIENNIKTQLRNDKDMADWYNKWNDNFVYFHLLRRFAGIHYNCYDQDLDRWNDDETFKGAIPWNRFKAESGMEHNNRFKTNLPEDPDGFWKGEMIRFVSGDAKGENSRVVNFKKDGKTLIINTKLPVKKGDEFVIDNCFNWKKPIKRGINMFGKKCLGRPWCEVYFYERTDRVTGPYNDRDKFK